MSDSDAQGPAEGPTESPAESPIESGAAAPADPAHRIPVWQESILLLVLAVVLAMVVKTFFVQAFYIPSGSMEPGLEINDRILVQKVSYWGDGSPERGDIIVFEDPANWLSPSEEVGPGNVLTRTMSRIGLYPSGGHLVKRVIGVAGDVIKCCDEQGRVLVNGVPLDSSDFILTSGACQASMIGCRWEAGPVPDGELFVLGDHRDDSADSSYHLCRKPKTGCSPGDAYVPVDKVVGKVFARVWPASRFTILHRPDAFRALD